MRAGFFGGTFDPPHRGHLAVAKEAASHFALDTTFFAPVASQPLKPLMAHASFDDRLAMVRLLCGAQGENPLVPRFVASELDAPRSDGQPNFTIDTLRLLRKDLESTGANAGGIELFVVTGADSFLHLRRWRESDALLEAAEWIVVSRPEFSLSDLSPLALTPKQNARVHLLRDVHEPVSATEIRARLRAGLDCAALLTPEVGRYIREHGLYQVPLSVENQAIVGVALASD